MLEDNPSLDDTGKRYVQQIVSGASRLDTLLDQLAALGRIAEGRLAPDIMHCSLRETLEQAQIPVEVPQDITVRADPEWLVSAIQDVAASLQYDDTVQLRMHTTHSQHAAQIHLSVPPGTPMVDTDSGAASIGITLARARLMAMRGDLQGAESDVVVTIPRG